RILEIPSRADWLSVHKELLRAEAQTEERDKLLARVSHELRTPLAPLLASLTELDRRIVPFADPEVHDCIQIFAQHILKEALLVNHLLVGFEIPAPEPVDPPES